MLVGVLVGVGVCVFVGVAVGVGVCVLVAVLVGVCVCVGVLDGVFVGVDVGDSVGVGVKSPRHSTQLTHGPLKTVTSVSNPVGSYATKVQQPIFVEPTNSS